MTMTKNEISKVLIVDDDKDLRRIYSRYLSHDGFKVLEASNGEQALLEFCEEEIDVILLDIRMPVANGQVLLPALQRFHPQSKIIVSSCYDQNVQKEMIGGAFDYFNKAEGYKVLLPKIKTAISQQKSA